MTGIEHLFHILSSCHITPHIHISDGITSPVLDKRIIYASSILSLHDILCVLKFLVNLWSISQLTKCHNYSVTFFLTYCVFQDLVIRKRIESGHDHDGLLLFGLISSAGLVAASTLGSPTLWHQCLVHPSLGKPWQAIPIQASIRLIEWVIWVSKVSSCFLSKLRQ